MKVAFICVHNSCRSQMAEAWAKTLLADYLEAFSAGTEEYSEVKPKAVEVMEEEGISMKGFRPKLIENLPSGIDIVITMGCGVTCPYLPSRFREDWGLEDPSGGSVEDFRITRDLIKKKVEMLKDRIIKGEFNL